MTTAELEMFANLLREAKYPVLVGESGIPAAVEHEGLNELMQIFAAVTEGYNTALQLLAASREDVKRLEQRLKIRNRLEMAVKKGD